MMNLTNCTHNATNMYNYHNNTNSNKQRSINKLLSSASYISCHFHNHNIHIRHPNSYHHIAMRMRRVRACVKTPGIRLARFHVLRCIFVSAYVGTLARVQRRCVRATFAYQMCTNAMLLRKTLICSDALLLRKNQICPDTNLLQTSSVPTLMFHMLKNREIRNGCVRDWAH